MTPTPDLQAIRQRVEKARQMVSDLCHQQRRWAMSVPAQPEYDPDLVISDGLSASEEVLTLWDTQQTALRALVEQWRKLAEEQREDAEYGRAIAVDGCADALARLLTPEQSYGS